MSRTKYTAELKIRIAESYLAGEGSYGELRARYGASEKSIQIWAQKYREHGRDAFAQKAGNAQYSKEFKLMCVETVLRGENNVDGVVAKYNISDRKVLRQWIERYNANKELKDYDPKREVYMAEARRKTTQKERKEIAEYCIAHDKDYKGTAVLYDVSYGQVYTWVKKYLAAGENGLADKRGHHKSDDEVDELERLRRENLRLKRKLEEQSMVVELLKKVKELEGK